MFGTPGGGPFAPALLENFRLESLHHDITNSSISAELKGNKQAEDIKAGMGSLGGLKKSL